MTWATIYHIDSTRMSLQFDFDQSKKEAVAAMVGSSWHKDTKRWSMPVARLGDVVKLFWPDVTIDYQVLRDRDEQLQRMLRQYQAMGVQFFFEDGSIRCSNTALESWFAKNGSMLHTQALQVVLSEPKRERRVYAAFQAEDPEDPALALWLRGVKNAARLEEQKQAMIANIKRKKELA